MPYMHSFNKRIFDSVNYTRRVLFATAAATVRTPHNKKKNVSKHHITHPKLLQANISPIKNLDNPSSILAEKRI